VTGDTAGKCPCRAQDVALHSIAFNTDDAAGERRCRYDPRRNRPGAMPISRLNARVNVASDS
jgi:hypothetical protein